MDKIEYTQEYIATRLKMIKGRKEQLLKEINGYNKQRNELSNQINTITTSMLNLQGAFNELEREEKELMKGGITK